MKKSAIKDIFHGRRGYIESMRKGELDAVNQKLLCNASDELQKRLSPELFALHEKYVEALDAEWSDITDFYFAEGFKLGLNVGMECMGE